MADMFASAKSILRRANHHITDLESHLKIFTADKPYAAVTEHDSKTGEYIHKLIVSEDFSLDAACILFDAVNNLRSTLDQMTYAIAVKHRGRRGETDFALFPFAKDADHWPNRINGLKNDLPPDIRTLFESFKPYYGGDNVLWSVNELANIKKHAFLVPVMLGGTTILISGGIHTGPFKPFAGRTEENEVIIYRSFEPPDRHPNVEITYRIVIDHPGHFIHEEPPVALLNAMSREVSRIMIETEAACVRLGLQA